eukprot:TRINITY_DN907_c0_g1_i1.p2 TRINITY_DN907_c0_g1~~TRINITY_DN907_c0_g1_i1.p2  ORF type:complete len:361 (+),score=146.50 TRINITY_DN907_c0_g1_i1:103-1083(+)
MDEDQKKIVDTMIWEKIRTLLSKCDKKKWDTRFAPRRIKTMMQEDEEIGKIASQVPSMIARASEVFVMHMALLGAEIARSRSAKTLSASHIKETLKHEKKFDFVRDYFAEVPDLPPPVEAKKPVEGKPKKRKPRAATTKRVKKEAVYDSDMEEDATEDEMDSDEEYVEKPSRKRATKSGKGTGKRAGKGTGKANGGRKRARATTKDEGDEIAGDESDVKRTKSDILIASVGVKTGKKVDECESESLVDRTKSDGTTSMAKEMSVVSMKDEKEEEQKVVAPRRSTRDRRRKRILEDSDDDDDDDDDDDKDNDNGNDGDDDGDEDYHD